MDGARSSHGLRIRLEDERPTVLEFVRRALRPLDEDWYEEGVGAILTSLPEAAARVGVTPPAPSGIGRGREDREDRRELDPDRPDDSAGGSRSPPSVSSFKRNRGTRENDRSPV